MGLRTRPEPRRPRRRAAGAVARSTHYLTGSDVDTRNWADVTWLRWATACCRSRRPPSRRGTPPRPRKRSPWLRDPGPCSGLGFLSPPATVCSSRCAGRCPGAARSSRCPILTRRGGAQCSRPWAPPEGSIRQWTTCNSSTSPVPAPRYPLRCPTLSYPTESEALAHPLPVFPAATVFLPCLVQRGVHR